VQQAGVYKVPATINGQVRKLFILDSGASEVTVPEEVFLTLFPETVDLGDMLPGAIYQLADGRVVAGDRFRIRSLTVGTQTFENVPASVGPPGSPLLLGQGVLTRVGRWSIDNVRGVLILGEPAAGGPASLPPMAPRPSRPSIAGGAPDPVALVNEYWARWSQSNQEALAYFTKTYASEVNFYGKPLSRGKVIDEKRRFSERWPQRVYTVRPASISVDCDRDSSTCTVGGVVDWDCRSGVRAARSIGSASFTFQLALSTHGPAITAESGSVIHREVVR
jgi:hypothetical protein